MSTTTIGQHPGVQLTQTVIGDDLTVTTIPSGGVQLEISSQYEEDGSTIALTPEQREQLIAALSQ